MIKSSAIPLALSKSHPGSYNIVSDFIRKSGFIGQEWNCLQLLVKKDDENDWTLPAIIEISKEVDSNEELEKVSNALENVTGLPVIAPLTGSLSLFLI